MNLNDGLWIDEGTLILLCLADYSNVLNLPFWGQEHDQVQEINPAGDYCLVHSCKHFHLKEKINIQPVVIH